MKIIEISKASKPLSDYAKELDDEIIVLTHNEKWAVSAFEGLH